jgi:hypothetical protein
MMKVDDNGTTIGGQGQRVAFFFFNPRACVEVGCVT